MIILPAGVAIQVETELCCRQSGRFGEDGGEVLPAQGLARLGKHKEVLATALKGCEWKVVLVSWIKSQYGVNNQWLVDMMFEHGYLPTFYRFLP